MTESLLDGNFEDICSQGDPAVLGSLLCILQNPTKLGRKRKI